MARCLPGTGPIASARFSKESESSLLHAMVICPEKGVVMRFGEGFI